MSTAEENPYKVLAVERTADARAIKKAYVALIRKFSPESHPEEFKKIRAAYELLSDEDAKKRFDDGEKGYAEYGEDVAKRIADADEALSQRNPELAREILEEVASKAPDVAVVREKLAFAYLNAGEHERALAAFDVLAEKEPENARHQLHRAFALSRLERTPQVEAALRAARELDPKDVRIALAMSDFFAAHGRKLDALRVIDEILPTVPAGAPPVFILVLRKVEICALDGDTRTAESAIEELKALVAKSDDPELSPFVAAQIASVAAKLFASSRSAAANNLLRWCETFDPSSEIVRPVPIETEARPEDLPPAFRDWLETTARDKDNGFVLRGRVWFLPSLAFLASTTALAFAIQFARSPAASVGVGHVVGTFLLLALPAMGAVLSARWIVQLLATPLRAVTTLHPLYVIHATPSRVKLFPLFALDDVRGVHQHTNGVYSGTSITLLFGGSEDRKQLHFSIYGKDAAQRWVDALASVRGRALELLAEGALEAEPLVDTLPPGALWKLPRAGAQNKRALVKPLIAAAVFASVMVPVTATSALRAGEDETFAQAAHDDTLRGYQAYLAAHPKSRHAEVAREALALRAARLASAFAIAPEGDPARVAFTRAIEHVRKEGGGIAVKATVLDSDDASAKALVERALAAAGLRELLSDTGQVKVSVRITRGGGRELVHRPSPSSANVPKPSAQLLLVGGVTGKATSEPPHSVLAPAYDVEVSVEVPGAPPFVEKVRTSPVTTSYAPAESPSHAARNAVAIGREAALDAAIGALGLLGPKARISPEVVQ